MYKVFAEHREKLELVVVPDLAKEGAFDEAVRGVQAIAHVASPATVRKLSTFKGRASQGVKVYGSNFTNYCGKIIRNLRSMEPLGYSRVQLVMVQMDFRAPAGVYTEEIWNESSAKEAESGSQNTLTMYCASKNSCREGQYKDEIKWDLSVVNPTSSANPLQELGSPQDLSETMEYWWYHVICEVPKTDEQLGSGSGWVDVRDVADAHVLALEKEEAGGERFLITADSFIWQDWSGYI
ncbi:hypothetical protein BKA70DRAFT_1238218 [Coprinopsis sp. MPI-PUGE-AT-0042]|nr:hypothetical protein BKA70DRAFT_1238218 [Coprinopsis sp. MPI-PUGE-AT-0042]